jgi:signal transduction histidine kinase
MRRLYQKIYLVFIASLLAVLAISALFWRMGPSNSPRAMEVEVAAEIASATLPPADASKEVQQEAVDQLARRLRADVGLFDDDMQPIIMSGRPVPAPSGFEDGSGRMRWRRGGPTWAFHLADDRWIVVRVPFGSPNSPFNPRNRMAGLLFFLGFMAIAIAVFAYPVVRSLTKRIERLQLGVETLGAGNLAARVDIEGRDEVASLAQSFNRAAGRIEELIGAHRLLLANASHELRTPLSRLRLGLELYETKQDPAIKAELARDIAELDHLIDEILLASRLDVTGTPQTREEVDLLALCAEECAHYDDSTLDGDPVVVSGDPRLLRRLIRNLLENAAKHGRPPITVELRRQGGDAVLTVVDAGDGIPAGEHEHIFMPFYRLGGDRKGAGLGLSLVRQIARLHGGDAVVAPLPGVPSRFLVRLKVD